MANVRNGNTYFIDTGAEGLNEKNQQVCHIMLTAVGGDALLVLADNILSATYPQKMTFKAKDGTTEWFMLDNLAFVFPNGVYVKTATNCNATLLLRTTNGT